MLGLVEPPLPGRAGATAYLPLAPADRPRLLLSADNSMGLETRLEWSSSAAHYLRDQGNGRDWSTRLPQHHPVVDVLRKIDAIGSTQSIQRYEYHDGYYDGPTREPRGFGQVDLYETRRQ